METKKSNKKIIALIIAIVVVVVAVCAVVYVKHNSKPAEVKMCIRDRKKLYRKR